MTRRAACSRWRSEFHLVLLRELFPLVRQGCRSPGVLLRLGMEAIDSFGIDGRQPSRGLFLTHEVGMGMLLPYRLRLAR